MGYKYGLCLVYEDNELKKDHIGHVTISNFMEKKVAERLYDEINEKIGNEVEITLTGKPEFFYSTFNINDKNKMCSWGYGGKCPQWKKYKKICENYECEFMEEVYTSMEYGIYPKMMNTEKIKRKKISCKLCCLDMRSDFPVDWKRI